VIVVDLGPDDLPLYARALDLVPGPLVEPPFVNVHRLMERIGVAVPALYLAAPAQRKLLVEDVGDLSLHEAVKADPGQTSELYRLALDELLKMHINGSANPDPGCMAYSIAYDRRLFRWEMEQFIEFGIPAVAPAADRHALGPELDRLAEEDNGKKLAAERLSQLSHEQLLDQSATKIQAMYRGHSVRVRRGKMSEDQEKAAVKIQSTCRGHVERKSFRQKYPLWPADKFEMGASGAMFTKSPKDLGYVFDEEEQLDYS